MKALALYLALLPSLILADRFSCQSPELSLSWEPWPYNESFWVIKFHGPALASFLPEFSQTTTVGFILEPERCRFLTDVVLCEAPGQAAVGVETDQGSTTVKNLKMILNHRKDGYNWLQLNLQNLTSPAPVVHRHQFPDHACQVSSPT